MSKVFVVDTNKRALNPIRPALARILLSSGKAAVLRRFPFTIVLKYAVDMPKVEPLRVKIDPGSVTTGIAVVGDASGEVAFAADLVHRGHSVRAALDDRRSARRSRRHRHTRYRQARYRNRRKPRGWLAPSSKSRIGNVVTWVKRLIRLCPIAAISQELVRFDTQLMRNPEIDSVEYQQGTLAGFEVKEYLLDKWQRRCSYCNREGLPLQIEHIQARARGGTDRESNLALACERCNIAKGTRDIREFLADRPDVLARILAQAEAPLRDAAAVNSTRLALYEQLKATGLPVEIGSGGLTKWNRTRRSLPKSHWIDATCVGTSTPEQINLRNVISIRITATGRQRRQMCLMDERGFVRREVAHVIALHGNAAAIEPVVPSTVP